VKSGSISKPLDIWTPTDFDIGNYKAGEIVQTEIKKVVESLNTASPAVITICEDRFVVYGSPTATNTIGYCHAQKEDTTFCVQVKTARHALQDAKRETKRCLSSSSFPVVEQQGNTKGVLGATSQSVCTGTI